MIQFSMTKDQLNRFNITGRGQHLCRRRAPATMRRTLPDTRLTTEPGDGSLQRITGPLYLWPAVQLTMLECEFKGLPLVRHDQL